MARILIVEDERVVARDLQRTLASLGHEVPATAASAEQALYLASEQRPDLVLMDVRIEGERDGIETAGLLRERFRVPIIYLTGDSDPATVERVKSTEPYGYLFKPVETSQLCSAVELALHRHRMEHQARERDERLQALRRSIGDAVVSADEGGCIQSMNPAAEAMTGWTEADALGRPSDEVLCVIGDQEPGAVIDPLGRCRRDGETHYLGGRLVAQQGGHPTIQSVTAPLRDERGELIGAVAVLRDVSKQARAQHIDEAGERLAAFGTMAAGLVYQLRSLLALVLASLRSTRQLRAGPPLGQGTDGGDDPDAHASDIDRALADAEWGSERARRIVAELSRMAHNGGGVAPTTADLHEPLARALELLRESVPAARVVLEPGEVPPVNVRASELSHIFSQLLISIVQSVPELAAGLTFLRLATRTDARGHALVEIVGDRGGSTLEPAGPLFEKPWSGDRDQGIRFDGFSACCSVVRTHGGDIELDARPGAGASVRVRLAARDARPIRKHRPGGRACVLVVEHEPVTRSIIGRALGGHLVTWTRQAGEALAVLQAGKRFHLILCDLDLPELGGVKLYRELERSLPDQAGRVVFLSGGSRDQDVLDLLGSATNGPLDKSLHRERLREAIRSVLSQACLSEREDWT